MPKSEFTGEKFPATSEKVIARPGIRIAISQIPQARRPATDRREGRSDHSL